MNRLMQRLMCRWLYGCDPCSTCATKHCIHCYAWGPRFIDRKLC